MKDTIHHRRYVQKKVIQSLRKEIEKNTETKVDGERSESPPLAMLDMKSERLSARRRLVRTHRAEVH